DVERVVGVAGLLVDVERERLGPEWIPADADDLLRFGVPEQVQCGVDAERPAAAQDRVGLRRHRGQTAARACIRRTLKYRSSSRLFGSLPSLNARHNSRTASSPLR